MALQQGGEVSNDNPTVHISERMLTLKEAKECEHISIGIMAYRHKLPTSSPCWMDEWALGYICALRDFGMLNKEQWLFLCSVFGEPTGK